MLLYFFIFQFVHTKTYRRCLSFGKRLSMNFFQEQSWCPRLTFKVQTKENCLYDQNKVKIGTRVNFIDLPNRTDTGFSVKPSSTICNPMATSFSFMVVTLSWWTVKLYVARDALFKPYSFLSNARLTIIMIIQNGWWFWSNWQHNSEIPLKQVMIDCVRRSNVVSGCAWCPADNIDQFCEFKMASKMAANSPQTLENCINDCVLKIFLNVIPIDRGIFTTWDNGIAYVDLY